MIQPGLVSITFRKLTSREIVDVVCQGGLAGIEWGGDVHVPHGDLARAREVRRMTADAGLITSAYGSYYSAGHSEADGLSFTAVCETARELAAPIIRVWAGQRGPADADGAYSQTVIADLRRIAELASAAGVTIGLEFHSATLTETAASTRQLLDAVDHPALTTFWQPPLGRSPADCLADIALLGSRLANVHVFHWGTGFEDRRPLAEGAECWRQYLRAIERVPRERFASLEYVRDDDPRAFLEDAQVLREWVAG